MNYNPNLLNHDQCQNLWQTKRKQKKLQNKKLKARTQQLQTSLLPPPPSFLFSQLEQNYSRLNHKILRQPTRQVTSQPNSFLFSQRKTLILTTNKPLSSHKPVIPTSQTFFQKLALHLPSSNHKLALYSHKLTLLSLWYFLTTIALLLFLLTLRLLSQTLQQSSQIMKLLRELRMKFQFTEIV